MTQNSVSQCPAPTGVKEQHDIQLGGRLWHVEIDTSLMPDDDFRATLWNFTTLRQMAEHLVWNLCIQRFSECEGLWPEQQKNPEYFRITMGEYNGLADPDDDLD